MTHYEARLEQDWATIHGHLTKVSLAVEKAVENAVDALMLRNSQLAYQTILGDNPINRAFEHINQLCYAFVARHSPSAGHLRRISSILRYNIELERIGDYAVTICREMVQITSPLEKNMLENVEAMSQECRQILNQAVIAFREDNVALAKSTMTLAGQAKLNFEQVFNELTNAEHQEGWSLRELFGLLAIYNALGRISDQAKNICEETVFIVIGETKKRAPVKVLFVDQGNHCQSLLAEWIAKTNFPQEGQYTSAGKQVTDSLHADFIQFMLQQHFDVSSQQLKSLAQVAPLSNFNVIVSLQGPLSSYFSKVPFRTVILEWEVGEIREDMTVEYKNIAFEKMYQEITFQVQNLMETLRGKENP